VDVGQQAENGEALGEGNAEGQETTETRKEEKKEVIPDTTVVYYTSNREKPEFERRIIETLIENSAGLPIISVSQKPMDLGMNICVGDVGASNHNAFRQMQIGAQAAKTDFVCTAESDYLYPKEYFGIRATDKEMFCCAYRTYMVYEKEYYYSRRVNEAAMIVGRDYLIQALEDMLAGSGVTSPWHDELQLGSLFIGKNRGRVTLRTPLVTFKTPENMHKKHHKRSYVKLGNVGTLPYWGTASEIFEKYCA
jgi:hypothetical protein